MSDQPTRRQRLSTFCARNSYAVFPIARTFVDRLAPAFPGVRGMIALVDKTDRFDFACTVSTMCKSIDDLGSLAPMIEDICERLADRGFTDAHIPVARAAFMNAVREHAGAEWTAEIERDWAEVCNEFFAGMNPRAMQPAMLSVAA